jgi:hypothetical protein
MEAATWTAIAVLAAANLGTLFYLGARIDAQGARLDARIDALGADLGSRIDSLSARVDAQGTDLGARLDVLTQMMAEHMGRHAG